MSTRARGRVLVVVAAMVAVWLLLVTSARAGTYDVQVCTDFGEGPGAFVGSSTGAGFQTAARVRGQQRRVRGARD